MILAHCPTWIQNRILGHHNLLFMKNLKHYLKKLYILEATGLHLVLLTIRLDQLHLSSSVYHEVPIDFASRDSVYKAN